MTLTVFWADVPYLSPQDLINHLLSVDLTRRLGCMRAGAKAIKEHAFFAGFDWKALADRKQLFP